MSLPEIKKSPTSQIAGATPKPAATGTTTTAPTGAPATAAPKTGPMTGEQNNVKAKGKDPNAAVAGAPTTGKPPDLGAGLAAMREGSLLKRGGQNDAGQVKGAQDSLRNLKDGQGNPYLGPKNADGSDSSDGKLGAQTQDAIKKFQKDNNLPVDGQLGDKTLAKMKEVGAKQAQGDAEAAKKQADGAQADADKAKKAADDAHGQEENNVKDNLKKGDDLKQAEGDLKGANDKLDAAKKGVADADAGKTKAEGDVKTEKKTLDDLKGQKDALQKQIDQRKKNGEEGLWNSSGLNKDLHTMDKLNKLIGTQEGKVKAAEGRAAAAGQEQAKAKEALTTATINQSGAQSRRDAADAAFKDSAKRVADGATAERAASEKAGASRKSAEDAKRNAGEAWTAAERVKGTAKPAPIVSDVKPGPTTVA